MKTEIAGWLLTLIGGLHLALGLALRARPYFGEWLRLRLWGRWRGDNPSAQVFWGTLGGLGAPVLLLGAMLLWMASNDLAPPVFLGWGLLGWTALCALIVEPTPAALMVVAALLLVSPG